MVHNIPINFKSRRNTSYSREGCIQCKISHKKCDESKPACIKCLKRDVECQYKTELNFKKNTTLLSLVAPKNVTPSNVTDLKFLNNKEQIVHLSLRKIGTPSHLPTPVKFEEGIQATASLFFPKVCLQIKDLLNSDEDLSLANNEDVSTALHKRDLRDIVECWRSMTWYESFQLVKQKDVIDDHVKFVGSAGTSKTKDFKYEEKFEEFVFIVGQWLILSNVGTLFPMDEIEKLLHGIEHHFKNYPFVKLTMIFVVSGFLSENYESIGFESRSIGWNTHVKVAIFSLCLNSIEEVIKKGKEKNFDEYVALIFSIFLLFPMNSRKIHSSWRQHLLHFNYFLEEAEKLKVSTSTSYVEDSFAFDFHSFFKSWFACTEICAQIKADYGGSLGNDPSKVSQLSPMYSISNVEIIKKLNFYSGMSQGTHLTLKKLALDVLELKCRGILISGNHIIYHKMVDDNPEIRRLLNQIGRTTLQALENESQFDKFLELTVNKYKESSDIGKFNYELLNSFKKSDHLMKLCISIYCQFFLINSETEDYSAITLTLKNMLEIWFAFPLATLSLTLCLSPIYYAALISIMVQNKALERQFIEIMTEMGKRGCLSAVESLEKLISIKQILQTKKYELLSSPQYDLFV